MALIGYRSNRSYVQSVVKDANAQRQLPLGQTAGNQNFDLISGTNLYKARQAGNELDFGQMDSVKSLSDALGSLSKLLTEYGNEYPDLTKAIAGTATSLQSLSGLILGLAGLKYLSSGFGRGELGTGGGFGGILARAGGITVPVMYITAGAITLSSINDKVRDNWSKKDLPGKVDSLAEGTSGYTTVEVAWELIKNRLKGNSNIKVPESSHQPIAPFPAIKEDNPINSGLPSYLQRSAQPGILNLNNNIKLEVDGKVLAETVNEYNLSQSARGPQGGH